MMYLISNGDLNVMTKVLVATPDQWENLEAAVAHFVKETGTPMEEVCVNGVSSAGVTGW